MYRTYVALYSCLNVHYLRFGTSYTCVDFILTFYSFALCLLLALLFTYVHLTCVRSTYVVHDHLARTYVFYTSTPDKYDQNTSRKFLPCDVGTRLPTSKTETVGSICEILLDHKIHSPNQNVSVDVVCTHWVSN